MKIDQATLFELILVCFFSRSDLIFPSNFEFWDSRVFDLGKLGFRNLGVCFRN
jgi:hypothetical protein